MVPHLQMTSKCLSFCQLCSGSVLCSEATTIKMRSFILPISHLTCYNTIDSCCTFHGLIVESRGNVRNNNKFYCLSRKREKWAMSCEIYPSLLFYFLESLLLQTFPTSLAMERECIFLILWFIILYSQQFFHIFTNIPPPFSPDDSLEEKLRVINLTLQALVQHLAFLCSLLQPI